MSNLDLLVLADVSLRLATADELLTKIGFEGAGELERFLTPFGAAVHTAPMTQRPNGCVFVALPATRPFPQPSAADMTTFLADVAKAQAQDQIIECSLDLRTVRGRSLDGDLRRQLSGGKWTEDQASRLSSATFSTACVCWASGTSFRAFVAGVTALAYADVSDRSLESAAEALQRQGWADGELLRRCAEEDLTSRSRLGIWEAPDLHVLRRRPEELIQEILERYLKTHLKGFETLSREYAVPNEGRVDLLITLADRRRYIVEVKWVGRSIKEGVDCTHKTVKAALKAKWKCKHVMVLDVDDARKGSAQMAFYFRKLLPEKGYLVVYDCRATPLGATEAATHYPKPKDLRDDQYRVHHVRVDPRTASVKSGTP
jgi:hypothetical protein